MLCTGYNGDNFGTTGTLNCSDGYVAESLGFWLDFVAVPLLRVSYRRTHMKLRNAIDNELSITFSFSTSAP